MKKFRKKNQNNDEALDMDLNTENVSEEASEQNSEDSTASDSSDSVSEENSTGLDVNVEEAPAEEKAPEGEENNSGPDLQTEITDEDENSVDLEEFMKPFKAEGEEASEENTEEVAEETTAAPVAKRHIIPTDDERSFMSDIDAIWSDKGQAKQHTISVIVVLLVIGFIIWASWATVDELTRGQGQVIASSRTQVISHLEGGILTEILVNEGVIVEQGQVLARVENVSTESAFRDTQTRVWEHEAAILRLEAELDEKPLEFPEYLREFAPTIVAREQQVYLSRQQQYLSEISVLQSQLQQTQYELDDLSRRLDTTNEAISVADRRLELARPMLEQELYAELDFLNLQTESIRLQGEANSLRSNMAKVASALQEAKLRQELFESEYQTKIVEEISERLSEQSSLEQTLNTGSDRVSRTEIRSPMRGIVNRIVLNTKGSAVRPGEAIMEVVPVDDTLLIEAKIRPADIGFIYPNQEAVIKLTAYDYSIYGGLDAYVEQISADTIAENNEYFYLVRLRTVNSDFVYNGEILPIIPGMVASVDIITGEKTIMQYLLKPILKARDNALRER